MDVSVMKCMRSKNEDLTITRFENDILGELIERHLVKRGTDVRHLSIHRLVQYEYRNHMKDDLLQSVYDATAELLYASFPRQKVGEQMHSYWHTCAVYLTHGVALLDAYKLQRLEGRSIKPCVSFLRLVTNCAW